MVNYKHLCMPCGYPPLCRARRLGAPYIRQRFQSRRRAGVVPPYARNGQQNNRFDLNAKGAGRTSPAPASKYIPRPLNRRTGGDGPGRQKTMGRRRDCIPHRRGRAGAGAFFRLAAVRRAWLLFHGFFCQDISNPYINDKTRSYYGRKTENYFPWRSQ